MPGTERLILDYAGCPIEVEAAAADLAWLREQLCPHFQPRAQVTAAAHIQLRADPAQHARYSSGRPAQPPRLCAYVLDSGPLQLEHWGCAGREVVHDAFFDVFYRPEPGGVQLIDRQASVPRAGRIPLLRAVREPAMHAAWRSGALLLHAAAVGRGTRVLGFAGRKRAGKTTLLAACLAASAELRFVANDRLCLFPDGVARGLPSIVSLRAPTLELVPGLGTRLRASHYLHNHSLHEAATLKPAVEAWQDGRFGISQSQLCRLLDREAQVAGTLAALVFPRLELEGQGLQLHRMREAKARERLAASLLGASAAGTRSALFDLQARGDFPTAHDLRQRAQNLAARLPCFELVLGKGSSRDAAGLRAMLAECGI